MDWQNCLAMLRILNGVIDTLNNTNVYLSIVFENDRFAMMLSTSIIGLYTKFLKLIIESTYYFVSGLLP